MTFGGMIAVGFNKLGNFMRTAAIRWFQNIWEEFALPGMLLACLVTLPSLATSGESLPPIKQLINETLALCNSDREENISALNDLAAAQCYLGDFAAARKNLLPYKPDDWFQQTKHQEFARIEIELTGSEASIPKALW